MPKVCSHDMVTIANPQPTISSGLLLSSPLMPAVSADVAFSSSSSSTSTTSTFSVVLPPECRSPSKKNKTLRFKSSLTLLSLSSSSSSSSSRLSLSLSNSSSKTLSAAARSCLTARLPDSRLLFLNSNFSTVIDRNRNSNTNNSNFTSAQRQQLHSLYPSAVVWRGRQRRFRTVHLGLSRLLLHAAQSGADSSSTPSSASCAFVASREPDRRLEAALSTTTAVSSSLSHHRNQIRKNYSHSHTTRLFSNIVLTSSLPLVMAAVSAATTSTDYRRRHSVVDPNHKPMLPPVSASIAMASSNVYSPEPARSSLDLHRRPDLSRSGSISGSMTSSLPSDEDDMMPPTPGNDFHTRASRSTSSASRNNRFPLTLPIALPTSDPSRPMPSTATTGSLPPTPLSTAQASSPSDTNEFIIAIAAQERRVLELKEELTRAEADLATLKRQWTTHEAYKKRDSGPFSPITPSDDDPSTRMSLELDRRKLLMNLQRSPKEGRRKVFRGGHARTLSLLSPTKPEPDYSLLDGPIEDFRVPTQTPIARSRSLHHAQNSHSTHSVSSNSSHSSSRSRRSAGPTTAVSGSASNHPHNTSANALSKRATWQPRVAYPPATVGMSQLVEDLKLGFRTFYDDIRQITVGDEPVTGRRPNGSYIYSSLSGAGGPISIPAPSTATRARGAGKPHPYDPDSVRAAAAAARARNLPGLAASAVPHDAALSSFSSSYFSSGPGCNASSSRTPADATTGSAAGGDDSHVGGCGAMETTVTASTTCASPVASTVRRRSRDCEGEARFDAAVAAAAAKPKHFSWTPLAFDALDDSDWSNWESPVVGNAVRWGGSMGGADAIPSVDDDQTPLNKVSGSILDIGFPEMLSPSNIRRTAEELVAKLGEKMNEENPGPGLVVVLEGPVPVSLGDASLEGRRARVEVMGRG